MFQSETKTEGRKRSERRSSTSFPSNNSRNCRCLSKSLREQKFRSTLYGGGNRGNAVILAAIIYFAGNIRPATFPRGRIAPRSRRATTFIVKRATAAMHLPSTRASQSAKLIAPRPSTCASSLNYIGSPGNSSATYTHPSSREMTFS